jgi:hypothetical protein
MESISELVTSKKELVNSLKLVTSLENKLTNLETRVRVLEIAGELACVTYPNDLTGWYCKCYKVLGEQKFFAIASMAREGNKPKNLFGWLLKQEMYKAITR